MKLISGLLIFSLLVVPQELFSAPDQRAKEIFITLTLEKQPMKKVIERISRETGYEVRVDQKWGDAPVSGIYEKVSVEQFFKRVLRGENITITTDYVNKVISVRSFGSKEVGGNYVASGKSQSVLEEGESIETFHARQLQEVKDYQNDPDAVEPLTGVKLADIRTIHEEQLAMLEEEKNDPNAIEPLSGEKITDIKALNEAQLQQIEEYEKDPDAVEPLTGIKMSDIKSLHAKQLQQMEENKNNPDAIEPLTGMKLVDIKNNHERQFKIMEEVGTVRIN